MFEKIKRLTIKHIGTFIIVSVVVFALIVITIELMQKMDLNVSSAAGLVASIYNNKIMSGSQVLSAIEKYYNNQKVIVMLFNKATDYNSAAYRFFVTGKTAKFAQNTNYDNVIISNNYDDITSIMIKDTSIGYLSNYNRASLDSYSDSSKKNYISLVSKYKATLIKCNGVNLGIAFFRID